MTSKALSEEEPMLKRYLVLIGLIAGLLFISCGARTNLLQGESAVEKSWGRSYETAKFNQILNPDAGQNRDPVLGLDGQASEHNVGKYRETFKAEKTEEMVNILKLQ